MNEITIDYKPNAKQRHFHSSPADEVVYGGAKGGGKSFALVMEALAYGLEHPGATMYLFRETYDDLEANLIQTMKAQWDERLYSYHHSKHIATLLNGTQIYFRYIGNWEDANRYQGRSIDWIGVDELTKHEERSIQVLLSCLRSPKGFPPKFRATCNPNGIGFGWVKFRYIEATNYGDDTITDEISGNRIHFVPATVYDNDVLMQNDPAYVKRLENLPEDEKRAFLYGDWDSLQGQYFSMWRRDKHVVEPFRIPDHWKRYRSIDHGFNDPTAVYWHAVDPEGNAYTYRELYITETLASDIADMLHELSWYEDESGQMQKEPIQYTVASPDMWQKRGNGIRAKDGTVIGKSIAEVYMDKGISLIKADNSRVVGWQRVAEEMKWQHDQSQGDEMNQPRWKIFQNCYHLIRTLPYLVRDDKKVEDVADNQEDHAAESIRYFHMSRPIKAKVPEREQTKIERNKKKLIKRIKNHRSRMA